MAARPSRSSSIPIPRASSTTLPSFGDVLSMPMNASPPILPRPRIGSVTHSTIGMSPPARPTSRSYTAGGAVLPPVIPRIIRANHSSTGASSSASWEDAACTPPPSSPTRVRRPSAGAASLRSPSHRTFSHGLPGPSLPNYTPQVAPAPFPRPGYLEHSALRHLLQTELPPQLPPSRYAQPAPTTPAYTLRLEHAAVTPSSDSDEDSNGSPPPPPRPTPASATRPVSDATAMVGSSPVFRLPTRWSEQDRHTYLSVSADGRELNYNGAGFQSGGAVDNAGMARTNHPIPPACGIYYFEIEVLSKGQKAHISIGFTTSDARLNKLPGWEKNSWGYHGDDGFSFAAEKTGTTYGPTFGAGDIIGAGVDFSQNRAFFTKNGVHLGMVFEHIAEGVQVYPSVGLRHPNEGVRVNFGHTAFKFDIDDHVQQQRDAVWAGIQRTRIDWRVLDAKRSSAPSGSIDATAFGEIHDAGNRDTDMVDAKADEEGRDEASRLVLSYLVHHGYAKTAEALEAQLARAARARNSEDASNALPVPPPAAPPADSELDDADSPMAAPESEPQPETKALTKRLAIVDAVRRGDIDEALDGLRTRFPSVLARDDLLVQLKLRCRKFVELVNAAAEMKRRADFERDLDLGGAGKADEHGGEGAAGVDVAAMDVDDVPAPSSPSAQSKSAAEGALRAAIAYGKALRADYRHDLRPEVQGCLDKSFGVVAYHFPMDAGGEVGRWAGQEARDVLAGEVNQAILESQGFPARPALERVYRQTAASLVQLGFLGVGAAVFADVQRELLDT